ncbi:MAG: hypothetical protein IIX90_01060, partial [Clostridia bacterium]|nr:hypothetical protein [Clostridia bacterium]
LMASSLNHLSPRYETLLSLYEGIGKGRRQFDFSLLISTIIEPVDPKGLTGFPLYSEVSGKYDIPAGDRYPSSQRETEIPTIIGVI